MGDNNEISSKDLQGSYLLHLYNIQSVTTMGSPL